MKITKRQLKRLVQEELKKASKFIEESNGETPRLFVTTYGLYNDGRQFESDDTGFWFDVGDYDIEDLENHFKEKGLDDDPELMFTDFEGFPDSLYSESMSQDDLNKIEAYSDLNDDQQKIIEFLVNDYGFDLDQAISKLDDIYVYDGSITDYVEDEAVPMLFDSLGLDKHQADEIEKYFDYDSYAQTLEINGELHEVDPNTTIVGML